MLENDYLGKVEVFAVASRKVNYVVILKAKDLTTKLLEMYPFQVFILVVRLVNVYVKVHIKNAHMSCSNYKTPHRKRIVECFPTILIIYHS